MHIVFLERHQYTEIKIEMFESIKRPFSFYFPAQTKQKHYLPRTQEPSNDGRRNPIIRRDFGHHIGTLALRRLSRHSRESPAAASLGIGNKARNGNNPPRRMEVKRMGTVTLRPPKKGENRGTNPRPGQVEEGGGEVEWASSHGWRNVASRRAGFRFFSRKTEAYLWYWILPLFSAAHESAKPQVASRCSLFFRKKYLLFSCGRIM